MSQNLKTMQNVFKQTKLIVTDHADPSVGLLVRTFSVECPFDHQSEQEELEFFRNAIIEAYKEFADGKVTAEYDFEYDAIVAHENEIY